jgi:hypothetical protein
MGYTHYWNLQPVGAEQRDAWRALVADARTILEAPGAPEAADVTLYPDDMIAFEGVPPHETFMLDILGTGREPGDWFCKTARKPYDLLVTAVLLRAKHRLGDRVSLASDGTYADWAPARRLVAELFPGDPELAEAELFAGEVAT